MIDGPVLWYLNRATGVVLLMLLTLAVVLGALATGRPAAGRPPGRGVPRFVTQALHRNLALLAVVALVVHVVTAVADTYVDIRWWQVLVPGGATYEPAHLAMGTLALYLMVVVVVTALLRSRLGPRTWHAVHLLAWGAWVLSVVHAVGIGTDYQPGSQVSVMTVTCVAAVLVALTVRLVRAARRRQPERIPS